MACATELAPTRVAGEERKVVSVLFVDLVGFTDRSDRADPEDVRALLRPYHERVKADIERFGGTVEKFIGDAVMAVFGAPVAHEDDAERAVRAALRILETIAELREEGLEVAVRAAVTTGEAVVALGARPDAGEGMVTGDVVNTAARLQGAAPVGGVIVDTADDAVRRRGRSRSRSWRRSRRRGRRSRFAVWRAEEARSRVGSSRRPPPGTPFVGREHELTLLIETFCARSASLGSARDRRRRARNREEPARLPSFAPELDDRPDLVTWRHGRCLPYGEGITFWALGEIVKSEAGILETDDPQEARASSTRRSPALFADEAERAGSARGSRRSWVRGGRRGSRQGGGVHGVAAISSRRWRRGGRCILVVEDMHWADVLSSISSSTSSTGACPSRCSFSAPRAPSSSSAARAGAAESGTRRRSGSPRSRTRMLPGSWLLLERTLLPAETQSVLLERAGGNPLYAEQFARMLVDRGDAGDIAVPETVQALIAARLDTLRPSSRRFCTTPRCSGRSSGAEP